MTFEEQGRAHKHTHDTCNDQGNGCGLATCDLTGFTLLNARGRALEVSVSRQVAGSLLHSQLL